MVSPEPRPDLSIVIPAYNEGRRLGRTLTQTLSYLSLRDHRCDVLVVDDGSRDRTAEIVLEFEAASRGVVRLLKNPGNRGKGFAVRHGVMNARGDVIAFFDADLSTPLHEIDRTLGLLGDGTCDVVIGSRGGRQRASQPLVRRLMGRSFQKLRQRIVGLDFEDTQCGFKAFRREAAHQIFAHQRGDGFAFDVEILLIARDQGWRVRELQVQWDDQPGSKVMPLRSSLEMLRDIVRLRWRRRRPPRNTLHASVRLVGPDGVAEDCTLENVHLEGMFVRTDRRFAVRDRVMIFLPLADRSLLGLEGRVAHTQPSGTHVGIGVTFVSLNASTIAALHCLLERAGYSRD